MSDAPYFALRAPATLEEAMKDMRDWESYKILYPEEAKFGGITISTQLMQDICTRLIALEQAVRGE